MRTIRCRIGEHGRRCGGWGTVRGVVHLTGGAGTGRPLDLVSFVRSFACGCGCHVPVVDVPANGYGRGRFVSVLEGPQRAPVSIGGPW